ncbi:MAG: MBL fold metallo-hydrolase [Ignavibacteria bacterium]|jgi:glyoxylase-like metal-dependent hydrolase (beta-lactamase superfamily II)|nr:MBL fold metallo-hydrolase [Ignavibacteria bacterium]
MNVIRLTSGPIENNTYLVFDKNKTCALVDAPFDCYDAIRPHLEKNGLNLTHIFITHTHWDHIGGLAELKRETNAKIYVHKDDAFRLSIPEMELGGSVVQFEPVTPDVLLAGGEIIECGDMSFEVLHTPGHSPGGVCYLERNANTVFVGDTLFYLSIGRTDFEGSDFGTLINSIKTKLLTLPDNYKVLAGHNETTTIGFERQNNPFFR